MIAFCAGFLLCAALHVLAGVFIDRYTEKTYAFVVKDEDLEIKNNSDLLRRFVKWLEKIRRR